MRTPWRLLLVFAAVGALAVLTVPTGDVEAALDLTVAATSVMAVAIGIRWHRPPSMLGWLLVLAGIVAYYAGDVSFYVVTATGEPTFPTLAEAAYVASYALLLAGFLLLAYPRDRGREVGALLDALIIATSAGLLYWVVVIDPRIDGRSPVVGTFAVGYFVIDVVLLAIAALLVTRSRARPPAFLLASAAAAALVLTDAFYGARVLERPFQLGAGLTIGWLAFYALLGAAALHPSMSRPPVDARPPDARRVPPLRLVLLGGAVLVAPAVVVVEWTRDRLSTIPVLAGASALIGLLALARIGLILSGQAAAARRERVLLHAADALTAATDRQEMHDAALTAACAVAGGDRPGACLALVTDSTLEVVATRGEVTTDVVGRQVELRQLPQPVGSAPEPDVRDSATSLDTTVVAALGLADLPGHVHVSSLRIREGLLGTLVCVTRREMSSDVGDALDTVATQLALALESAAVTEARHLRQSEARFRALIQGSWDAILMVDEGSVVRYQSPSFSRVFGHEQDALLGRRFSDLVRPDHVERARAHLAEVATGAGTGAPVEICVLDGRGRWVETEVVAHNRLDDPNVGAVVITIHDVSERNRLERELVYRSFYDTLTGLANTVLFADRVEQAVARQARTPGLLALLVLDLDEFSSVNDGLGRAAGDQVLQTVAMRLTDVVRSADTIARVGADEFAVLLVDLSSEDDALRLAGRISDALRQPTLIQGKEVVVSASVGISFAHHASVTAQELLHDAHAATYASRSDRDRPFAVYQPGLHAHALHRLELRADLERALDRHEFVLMYQPIVSLGSARTEGLEALVRWQHPRRGLVPPLGFIGFAEETGLVIPLGRWVFEQACRQVFDWRDASDVHVSINLSQRQLRAPTLHDELRGTLERTGADPTRITLEVTESAVMSHAEAAVGTLRRLRDLGLAVAIDDFGTGYSSLSWLRQLPLDIIKIDKEFTARVAQRDEDRVLVRSVIDLAHSLGLRTVAEGIEDEVQLALLRDLGCDLGQGFHFARPLDREGTRSWLQRDVVFNVTTPVPAPRTPPEVTEPPG